MIKVWQLLQRRGTRGSTLILLMTLVLLLAGCLRQGVYHQVEPGQTLYRISKAYQVEEAYLARINGISNPTQLRVGARVFIPGAVRTKYVPATVPIRNSAKKITPATKSSVKINTPAKLESVHKSAPEIEPAVKMETPRQTPYQKPSKVNIKLHWPLRGKILRAFGQDGKDGGRGGGKGLEIAAQEGTKVSAAAAGKVIYSGNGVQGFGHLMILQHEGDVFTVYGFNSLNYVKQGQFVSQGERIASSGKPPSGEAGRLHFEVRIGKVAVDPILYLP